jgi:hypothetical protein
MTRLHHTFGDIESKLDVLPDEETEKWARWSGSPVLNRIDPSQLPAKFPQQLQASPASHDRLGSTWEQLRVSICFPNCSRRRIFEGGARSYPDACGVEIGRGAVVHAFKLEHRIIRVVRNDEPPSPFPILPRFCRPDDASGLFDHIAMVLCSRVTHEAAAGGRSWNVQFRSETSCRACALRDD